jgi:hypothetical protein
VSVDDDTVCDLGVAAAATGSDAWSIETGDARDFWFFRARASALSALRPTPDVDFLGLYHALGRDPASLIAAAPDRPLGEARTLEPRTLRRLLQPGARVRYGMPGLAGDCGTWAPYYLNLTGPSRERLVRTEADYAWACRSRETVRCVPRFTVSPPALCMAFAVGLDNTSMLPPFLPSYRNSDGLWAWTLGRCDPQAFRVDLPYALVHDPDPSPAFQTDVSGALYICRVSEVMAAAMGGAAPLPAHHDPARRLRAMGTHLVDIAAASRADFEAAIRDAVHSSLKARMRRLDQRLKQFGAEPGYWAEDVRRALAGIHAQLTAPGPVLPWDLKPGRSDEDCRSTLQRLARDFGRLMIEWDGMREAAGRPGAGP